MIFIIANAPFLRNSIKSNPRSADINRNSEILLFQVAIVIKIYTVLIISSPLLYSFQWCNLSIGIANKKHLAVHYPWDPVCSIPDELYF